MKSPTLNVTFSSEFDKHKEDFSLTSVDPNSNPSTFDFSSNGIEEYAHQAWDLWFAIMPIGFYDSRASIEVHIEYLQVGPFPGFVAMVNVGSLSMPQYQANVTNTFHELLSGEDSNGSEPDMIISVGSLLGSRYGGISSVLAHEFGHALGLSLQEPASVFAQLVSNGFFVGESATIENGGPVPVAADGHIVNPAKSNMGGNSLWPATLDVAMLRDLGLFQTKQAIDAVPTNGNDNFSLTPDNDNLDGLLGVDFASFGVSRSQISISKNGNSITATGQGTDTLVNIERLVFTDGTLAFDTDGIAGQAYRIYKAAFARTPDNDGLKFWIGELDGGMTLVEAAAGFISSVEFNAVYGGAATNREIVQKFYQNVLSRDGEAAGISYWTGEIDIGTKTTAQVLADFSAQPENVTGVAPQIEDGIFFT